MKTSCVYVCIRRCSRKCRPVGLETKASQRDRRRVESTRQAKLRHQAKIGKLFIPPSFKSNKLPSLFKISRAVTSTTTTDMNFRRDGWDKAKGGWGGGLNARPASGRRARGWSGTRVRNKVYRAAAMKMGEGRDLHRRGTADAKALGPDQSFQALWQDPARRIDGRGRRRSLSIFPGKSQPAAGAFHWCRGAGGMQALPAQFPPLRTSLSRIDESGVKNRRVIASTFGRSVVETVSNTQRSPHLTNDATYPAS